MLQAVWRCRQCVSDPFAAKLVFEVALIFQVFFSSEVAYILPQVCGVLVGQRLGCRLAMTLVATI